MAAPGGGGRPLTVFEIAQSSDSPKREWQRNSYKRNARISPCSIASSRPTVAERILRTIQDVPVFGRRRDGCSRIVVIILLGFERGGRETVDFFFAVRSVPERLDMRRAILLGIVRFFVRLQLFRRLLDEHLSSMVGTSSSLETVPTISDANTSAWWWLSLLRTARFCDGKANREFRLGFGCTLIEGKHDDDDVDPTKFTWDYVTIDILVVVVIAVIMYYTYTVIDQLSATRFALTDFSGRFVPPVPQKPQVSVISFPR